MRTLDLVQAIFYTGMALAAGFSTIWMPIDWRREFGSLRGAPWVLYFLMALLAALFAGVAYGLWTGCLQ